MATFYAPAAYGAYASGDTVYFYNGDTTTPAVVYADYALVEELGTSVTADSDGGFPNIYLSDDITYKAVIIRSGGDVSAPLKTTYPLNVPPTVATIPMGSITADMLATTAVTDSLGYIPVNRAGDTMSGDLLLSFTPTTRDQKSVGFRGAGVNNTQNGTYTFVLADTGKVTQKTDTSTPTWTLPTDAAVATVNNDLFLAENNGASGDVTIAAGMGGTLSVNGSNTNASFTLAPSTSVALKKVGANAWRVL